MQFSLYYLEHTDNGSAGPKHVGHWLRAIKCDSSQKRMSVLSSVDYASKSTEERLDWLQFKKFASFGTIKGAQQLLPIFFSYRPPFVQLRLSQILKASYFTVADWRRAFPSVLTSWCKKYHKRPFPGSWLRSDTQEAAGIKGINK